MATDQNDRLLEQISGQVGELIDLLRPKTPEPAADPDQPARVEITEPKPEPESAKEPAKRTPRKVVGKRPVTGN